VLNYNGINYDVEAGETVLGCLERHGVNVPSFCRNGACQTCLLKVTDGTPPARAQAGLREAWKRQGFVLSCVCDAAEPLSLEPADAARTYSSRVVSTEYLSPSVVKVVVEQPEGFSFEGGQFVQLGRASDQLSRPYSIASLPSDDYLEFHVAVYPDGALSPWLAAATGESVTVTGPFGDCTYVANEPERPLILAGTGTGLAPLVAVLRAAVAAAHRGPIALYHGAKTERDLYYWAQLEALDLPPHVTVRGVCLEVVTAGAASIATGDLAQTLLAAHPKPEPARTYLCGNPTLVQTLKKRLYLAGASLSRIHSDPFLPRASPA
jgi:CDP-4-dehydro-6-deoxyglucose reductase, E3